MSERIVHSPLLPQNQMPLEAALVNAAELPLNPERIAALWDAEVCPVALLPWLAWALSVDEWDDAWTEGRKRAAVLQAVQLHRKKGTPWAVLRALEVHGYPGCELIEYAEFHRAWQETAGLYMDGTWGMDGRFMAPNIIDGSAAMRRAVLNHWAQYAIRVNAAEEIWNRDAQRGIAQVAKRYAPARAHLVALVGLLRWGHRMKSGMRGQTRLRVSFSGCTRLTSSRMRHMDGCWIMDADKHVPVMDATWAMDGSRAMQNTYVGLYMDGGSIQLKQRLRMRLGFHAGSSRSSVRAMASKDVVMDGCLRMNTHTLSGTWSMGHGQNMAEAQFQRLGLDRMNGTAAMGHVGNANAIWMHGTVTVRRGGQTTKEPL